MTQAEQARSLFQSRSEGVLSTISVEMPGYPFGSITPYCVDNLGQPVILISTIAQHTKNITANNKVSLISHDPSVDDTQAAGRVTYLGNAFPVYEEEVAERYYRYFPNSRNFHNTHDFDFYTLEFIRVRYVGGFGEIHWLEKEHFLKANPFSFKEETNMLDHMNNEHQDAINHYSKLFDIPLDSETLPKLVGIDALGFHLRSANRLHRINFEEPVSEALEVRKALVDLARKPL